MAHSWYDVFKTEDANIRAFPGNETAASDPVRPPVSLESVQKIELQNPDTLASLLILQSNTVDRLVRDNDKLMDRVEKLLHIQEREQALRLQMQDQIMTLANQVIDQAATADPEEIIKETRRRLTAEIRPVLLALVEAVEENKPTQELANRASAGAITAYSSQDVNVSFSRALGGKSPADRAKDPSEIEATSPKADETDQTTPKDLSAKKVNVITAKPQLEKAAPAPTEHPLPYSLDNDDEKLFASQKKLPKILMRPVEDLEAPQLPEKTKSRPSRIGFRFFGGR